MDYERLDAMTCEGLRLLREERAAAEAVDAGGFVPGRFPKRSLAFDGR